MVEGDEQVIWPPILQQLEHVTDKAVGRSHRSAGPGVPVAGERVAGERATPAE